MPNPQTSSSKCNVIATRWRVISLGVQHLFTQGARVIFSISFWVQIIVKGNHVSSLKIQQNFHKRRKTYFPKMKVGLRQHTDNSMVFNQMQCYCQRVLCNFILRCMFIQEATGLLMLVGVGSRLGDIRPRMEVWLPVSQPFVRAESTIPWRPLVGSCSSWLSRRCRWLGRGLCVRLQRPQRVWRWSSEADWVLGF